MIEHDAAQRLFQRIKAHHQGNGGTITSTEWLRLASEEFKAFADQVRGPKKPRHAKPINKLTEEEFIKHLEAEPSFAGVDIQREIGKCQFYWSARGKSPSRMRVINWLNKADRSVKFVGDGKTSFKPSAPTKDKRLVPSGWREFMLAKMDAWEEENGQGGIYTAPGREALTAYDDFYRMPKSWQEEAWSAVQQSPA